MFPDFLKRSLVFPLLLFPSIIKHCSLKKAFLSLVDVFWDSMFNWMYLSLSPLLFASLYSSAICKASSDNHFAFLLFFLEGMVLFATSCTVLWTTVHNSSGTPLIKSSPLNLFVTSAANSHGIWFKSYLPGLLFFLVFYSLSWILLWKANDLRHSQVQALFLLTVYSFCIFGSKEYSQSDFSIDHLVMSMCIVVSCVVGRGCLLWLACFLGRIQLTFALLHFVPHTCLLHQVYLDFLLLHSNPQWWIEHLF